MCEVCAIFGAGDHWSDLGRQRNELFPFNDIQHYRGERRTRLLVINDMLAEINLSVADWDGETVSIIDSRGRMVLSHTLSDFWQKVEELSGFVIDPLNDTLFTRAGSE